VLSEEFYVNEKSTDTSWDRTSDLPICSTAPLPLCYRGPLSVKGVSQNRVTVTLMLRMPSQFRRSHVTRVADGAHQTPLLFIPSWNEGL